MTLLISMTTASSELGDSPITKAITQLATTIAIKKRDGLVPTSPTLDLTFCLPGKFDKPNFTGMRMGSYDASHQTLYFEKAVPDHIVHSSHAMEFVSVVMQDMLDGAQDFFNSERFDAAPVEFDVLRWQWLVNQVADVLKALGSPNRLSA